MEAAGLRLSSATTTAERVTALRAIEAIATAYPDAPDARLLAQMLGREATQEAGPAAMLDALGVLAGSGEIADIETYASIVGPMMGSVADMQQQGTLFGSSAIALDDAIKALDGAAAKAGLPSIGDAISQVTGSEALGKAVTGSLGQIAAAAKVARDAENFAEMDQAQTREFIGNMVAIMPPGATKAIDGLPMQAFTYELAWEKDMYGESAKALNLVADAIETGELDQEAYGKIHDRLTELSKGPWGKEFAKDALKSLCKSIPVVGNWCDDIFKLAEDLVGPVDCGAISCDCENVGGGLMRGPLIVQCRMQEATVQAQCKASDSFTSTCDDGAKGPDADY